MNKKQIVPIIIAAVVVGALGFAGGVQYGKAVAPQGGSAQVGAAPGGQGTGRTGGMTRRGGAGSGFAGGQIISKNDTSITLQSPDGSSLIVFISTSTPVTKSVQGSLSDLTVGEQVSVTGSTNSDGSIVAQSVQVRPAMQADKARASGATTTVPSGN
jgi:hypothetical protein